MSYIKQKEQLICKCGEEHFIKLPIVLTSNPPQWVYQCSSCGEHYTVQSNTTLDTQEEKVYI
jgi:transposase-like protein